MKDLFFSTIGEALSRHNLSWHWRPLMCQAHLGSVSHTGSQHREHSWCWTPDLRAICFPGLWLLGFIGVRGSAPSGLALGRPPGLNTHQQPGQSRRAPESSANCFWPQTNPARALQDWSLALSRPCSWGWVGELDSEMHWWPKLEQHYGNLQWVPDKRCMSSLPCRMHLHHCPEMETGRCFRSNATEMMHSHKVNATVSQKLFTLIPEDFQGGFKTI